MTARSVAGTARRVARDVGTIVAGTRADGSGWSPGAVARDLGDYARVVRLLARGDGPGASVAADRLLVVHPGVRMALHAAAFHSSRRGELTASLVATRRLRAMHETRRLRDREQELEDRLLETDPAWLPQIDGQPSPTPVRSRTAVMHLLKTSLPQRQSGYTIRSAATLRAQRSVGLEPFAVTPFGFPPATRGVVPATEEIVEGIVHHRLLPGVDLAGVTATEQLSRTAALAVEVMRHEGPAIVHAHSGHHGYDYGLVAAALKAHTGRPFVYEVRGFLEASWTSNQLIAERAEQAELTLRRLATEARVMAAADGIATLGTAMRDELVARGVPADRIELVPNGIDPEAFTPAPRDTELARSLGLEGRWVFGYISNLDHFREGQGLLIDAAGLLVAEGRQVACLIVGDGLRRQELEAQVARQGLRSTVVFTGRVPHDRVRDHYLLLDAFVVPRVADRAARFTTPLKPYEAMALEIPLVVSDLPALVEIAAPDERGLAFPAGDAAALADRLRVLMDHPETARRIAVAGREWVVAERTWSSNARRYAALYERILERYPDPPPG
ncbi:MAG TPA: glycosyltransferase family 4 protein [Candidatus Limnocylindrales bacterium]